MCTLLKGQQVAEAFVPICILSITRATWYLAGWKFRGSRAVHADPYSCMRGSRPTKCRLCRLWILNYLLVAGIACLGYRGIWGVGDPSWRTWTSWIFWPLDNWSHPVEPPKSDEYDYYLNMYGRYIIVDKFFPWAYVSIAITFLCILICFLAVALGAVFRRMSKSRAELPESILTDEVALSVRSQLSTGAGRTGSVRDSGTGMRSGRG